MVTMVYARNKAQERAVLWHDPQQDAHARVYSKIDWAFGNFKWMKDYGHVEADCLEPGVSDHSHILVQIWERKTIHPKPFKLYMVTMDHKEFRPMVDRIWKQQNEMDPMTSIWQKLHKLKNEAKGLNKEMEKHAMHELEKWSLIEERILRQKSRVTWIDYGDSNSNYFFAQLKIRASKNNITAVYNESGMKATDPTAVEQEFTNFFTQLMGKDTGLKPCLNTSYIKAGECLNLQQQQELIKEITHEEVDEAVRDMPNDKAPGVDSYPIEFFTKHWMIVRQDIYEVVSFFFQNGKMKPAWNCTAITLIPKVPAPTTVKDYRPIACCTTLYKIIAKILTKRLKKVIEVIIGKSQSAFIEGRSIIGNILFSHELFKGYTRKGLSPRCVLKVDLRKAYDSLDWHFLRYMLTELGFPQKFIHWVMECVSTVSYSLMLNGGLQSHSKPREESCKGRYKFSKNNAGSILQVFCCIWIAGKYRQKLNVYSGVPQHIKELLLESTRFNEGSIPFKYLGVPLSAKKLNIHQCLPLVEKITERVNCWSARMLSYSGRLQLIKSVLFGIQTYWAQIFLLPKKIMKMIETICRTFLWTGSNAISRKALIAWDKICQPKIAGGLNIINMRVWNKAAIIKQLWALAMKKDALWIKWTHNYYIKNKDIAEMDTPRTAAWVIRKIIEAKKEVIQMNSMHGSVISTLADLVKQGRFQIQKAYVQLMPQLPKVSWKSIHLHTQIHPRFKFHLWLAIHQRIATVDRLLKFGIHVPPDCVFCAGTMETLDHLYFECPHTRLLWDRILKWLGTTRIIGSWQDEIAWISSIAKGKNEKAEITTAAFAMVVYCIWRERNSIRFQKGRYMVDETCKEIALHMHIQGR
ncbi:PREDICTED: uncharacterized protein LOC109209643 [Nicotiana attenuata]|uniref:uncharacterized protein LOC109209643 n=1 Tax=Nicotiana attenuata TaxID=49451 RepID=UPI000905184A|nr:PREDICTED: uncharacterized protein LOC109209643 [Nicotiana attenuata]